ncbi:relaxase/mobilization nuclease domain-containing protein [uncultured Mucilaginibacter sp.]|uniref:relaxase/mobilization nuclease domain-containing protein n=1 Tax=uncultured Mucilaginibacter sp. TaxID=797541 RepID=UPI0025F354A6|nr:relaxase/mobilization nuclease domain-containing protein [uncultured Mucilaginibacter sp.]
MVAKIKTGRSIIGAINYNEHKVRLGKAELIMAQGYLKEPKSLSFSDKLNRLTDLTDRNERTQVNTLHVSLNFAVGEVLDKILLQQIADDYMEGLGFGGQPYLVYQHNDAGHPHLHIVTTNIKPDGERISFHLLANKASEESRKNVEQTFNLIKAEDQKQSSQVISPISLDQVAYGKTDTKRAITNVVNEIIRAYKFTSVPEFNALLNQFNITADRGSKDSRMFAKNGLIYWVIDANGQKTGVPIKASSIYGKPTMNNLNDRFKLNAAIRKISKPDLTKTIDGALSRSLTMNDFQNKLKRQMIDVVLRRNDEGRLYGITFIDHRAKTVFNGSDLGKAYSAGMLSAKLGNEKSVVSTNTNNYIKSKPFDKVQHVSSERAVENHNTFFESLFHEEYQDQSAFQKLNQKKRRKKRPGQNL